MSSVHPDGGGWVEVCRDEQGPLTFMIPNPELLQTML